MDIVIVNDNDGRDFDVKSEQLDIVIVNSADVRDFDVLCERGRAPNGHVGNRYYQCLIHANLDRYFTVLSSIEKSRITDEIVDMVRSQGGRFLKRAKARSSWMIIDRSGSKTKIVQALNYHNRKRGKTLREMLDEEVLFDFDIG